MDERPAGPPAATESAGDNVLLRRAGAAFVDLLTVAVAVAVTVARVAETFPAIRAADGTVGFTPDDQQRINEIAGVISRGHLVGDTLYAFSTTAVLTVLGATLVAGLLAGALVPILTGGRSFGKSLLGLRVVTTNGQVPKPTQHITRTLAAAADLMPVVVPGLTGYAFAVSNPLHQRLGDRLAGTVVVEQEESTPQPPARNRQTEAAKEPPSEATRTQSIPPSRTAAKRRPPRPEPPIHPPRQPARRRSRKPTRPAAASAERPIPQPPARAARPILHQQHSPIQNSSLNAGWLPPDLVDSTTTVPSRPDVRMAVEVSSASTRDFRPQRNGDPVDMSDNTKAPEPSRAGEEQSVVGRVPVEERPKNPYPKPTRTAESVEDPKKTAHFDSLTLPESSLSAMPLTNTALFEALGLSAEEIAGLDSGTEAVQPEQAPTATESDQPAAAKPNPAVGTPAPAPHAAPQAAPAVRKPAPAPVPQADPAVREPAPAPVPQAAPAVAASPSGTAPTPVAGVDVAERTVAPQTDTRQPSTNQAASPAPNRRAPIWSDDWDAWIYWDTTLRGWFRHDLESNTWVALSED